MACMGRRDVASKKGQISPPAMGAVRRRGRIIMASVACKTSITYVERRD